MDTRQKALAAAVVASVSGPIEGNATDLNLPIPPRAETVVIPGNGETVARRSVVYAGVEGGVLSKKILPGVTTSNDMVGVRAGVYAPTNPRMGFFVDVGGATSVNKSHAHTTTEYADGWSWDDALSTTALTADIRTGVVYSLVNTPQFDLEAEAAAGFARVWQKFDENMTATFNGEACGKPFTLTDHENRTTHVAGNYVTVGGGLMAGSRQHFGDLKVDVNYTHGFATSSKSEDFDKWTIGAKTPFSLFGRGGPDEPLK